MKKYWGINSIIKNVCLTTIICYLIFAFYNSDFNISTWSKESKCFCMVVDFLLSLYFLMMAYLSGNFGPDYEN
jgi:hypothetical protein